MVACPICEKPVREVDINLHIDSGCEAYLEESSPPATQANGGKSVRPTKAIDFFTSTAKRNGSFKAEPTSSQITKLDSNFQSVRIEPNTPTPRVGTKRSRDHNEAEEHKDEKPPAPLLIEKKVKLSNAPLAERMRPRTLDEVAGQDLVGPHGVLRNLIVTDRVPSMVLWGGPGTGKTTIARLIAQTAGTRFVEINSTSSGVAECKKLFAEAKNELGLTGRKTIIFCDEIHRFSKSQQDVFLGPVESGQVTLIAATTENPSFKVVNALLSRCRTFTLSKLSNEDIFGILRRALNRELPHHLLSADEFALVRYLATFADGDARTGLNLLELAIDLCRRPSMTIDDIKKSLTQTLVYDRAGDQHYDTISAFHKSVRGSNPDAALYYLARMLQSGEDPLYVARRMVVMASEDIGLADNSLLSLATATYTAAEKIGMPECRINLAHCAVALSLAPKSVRAYRGLNAAYAALKEPGVAGLPIPIHLRNAPTKLMKELGYGKEYKYNPDYVDGQVVQDYLPDKLEGRTFLGDADLGDKIDTELGREDEAMSVVEGEGEREQEILLGPDGD
ncbi:P-loop containing nucleoside triphosphate hydrolase protein [Dissoconium aciculare CBS 342.82]|uniref:P-loop containing nucleoside triphosphate hydrolase protein n=1 Tax=Dissoconium aciculare CBS 342.82 TaxID=1314786 RepID=A0A6J3MAY6_9PEZI|nr:P-loop containing nucleoside triphosphate hydrolase protein [Dissoconium aciculare CBS 342.82]KAF1823992.1 P-loop containing nucleoside triphosphate hydrolase protein [Dissoconium aciculare CBS 342.82]